MNSFAFLSTYLSGGDWFVFYKETINQLSFFPYLWSATNGNGFGQNISFILGYKYFFAVLAKFFYTVLNLSWPVTEKIIFFIPFWLLSVFSSYFFASQFFKARIIRMVTVIVFCLNSYSLMLIGGGQMGVALAYAFSPLSLALFFKSVNYNKFKLFLFLGLVFGFQIILDPRIALLVLLLEVSYLFYLLLFKELTKSIALKYVISFTGSIFLNLFWILPFLFIKQVSLASAYTSAEMVKFLSFATFENTVSLLHPNWPENIFGKIYFMRPEFLLIPLMAFFGLAFIGSLAKKQKKVFLFFALIAFIGAFLSKGTSEPFGNFYYLLSEKVPGFTMFRDPTKFYVLTIISYSVLIPFTLKVLSERFKLNKNILFVTFLLIIIFTIRQLFLGQLSGTFKAKVVPSEYFKLESFIQNDNSFYRTLWVPSVQRFGYFSSKNPSVSASELFNLYTGEKILRNLLKSENLLKERGIKYVIIPFDSEGEIFLNDRKFSEKEYQNVVSQLLKIPWLKEVDGFEKIRVFEVAKPKNLFWSDEGEEFKYKIVSPVEYQVDLKDVKQGNLLVFSQSYDINWTAGGIKSSNHHGLNSFKLNKNGNYSLKIYYKPQDWVNIGFIISSFSLVTVLGLIIWFRK